MNRPKGLLVTGWIMIALNVAGWILEYWPQRADPAHLREFGVASLVLISVAIRVSAFVCIYYFVRGRNWARVAVLLTSVLAVLGLFRLYHEATLHRINGAAWGTLGVFFLYWLNTRPIREFFKQNAPTKERP